MKKTSVYDTRYFVEYFCSRDEEAVGALKQDARETGEKIVSTVTIHEFYRINLGKAGRETAQLRCNAIRNEFKIIDLDYEQALLSAQIRNEASIPLAGSVIAAAALSRGCPVVSDDERFKKIQGLKTRWPVPR